MMYKNIATLIYSVRDAIVTVSCHYSETNTTKKSNGFFIKGHYIICPSEVIFNDKKLTKKILVDISNVNNSGKSYSYETELIGYDGAGNIAVLKINFEKEGNKNNPVLRNSHQFLPWGKSRNINQGEQIWLIGQTVQGSENSIIDGIISDNRYVSDIPGEMLLLSCSVPSFGLPVITVDGDIIGMSVGKNIALSEFFMRKPVKAIIKKNYGEEDNSVETVDGIFRVRKSFLGIFGILLSQDDYYESINFNNLCREIVGYKITHLNELREISVGDIVTQINGCPLGDRKGQISPSLVMWRLAPRTKIILTYKKQEEGFIEDHVVEVETKEYDLQYDFPLTNVLM